MVDDSRISLLTLTVLVAGAFWTAVGLFSVVATAAAAAAAAGSISLDHFFWTYFCSMNLRRPGRP